VENRFCPYRYFIANNCGDVAIFIINDNLGCDGGEAMVPFFTQSKPNKIQKDSLFLSGKEAYPENNKIWQSFINGYKLLEMPPERCPP